MLAALCAVVGPEAVLLSEGVGGTALLMRGSHAGGRRWYPRLPAVLPSGLRERTSWWALPSRPSSMRAYSWWNASPTATSSGGPAAQALARHRQPLRRACRLHRGAVLLTAIVDWPEQP